MTKRNFLLAMLCGGLGCLCFGGGDWLMIYGDTAYQGELYWLTEGAAQIAAWRNGLAMALSFPGIALYAVGLFALAGLVRRERERLRYRALTAFGLTPWLALHLFYIMILYLFAWMRSGEYASAALPACQALYRHLSWIIYASEAIMLPPFLYWAYLAAKGKTLLPRAMAVVNPLVFYVLLYGVKSLLPDGAFRIGFTNGLMSESMILCFLAWAIWTAKNV